ncbi:hypothetical protein Pelo_180 [Pelomyxa schiedti]|nr:hypothetical protein Pelo_180 [Pelomyxa schiedti]
MDQLWQQQHYQKLVTRGNRNGTGVGSQTCAGMLMLGVWCMLCTHPTMATYTSRGWNLTPSQSCRRGLSLVSRGRLALRLLCVGSSTLERHTRVGRLPGCLTPHGVYDDTYRNTLPSYGRSVIMTSWIPSTNQLLVIDNPPDHSEHYSFIFDNVTL